MGRLRKQVLVPEARDRVRDVPVGPCGRCPAATPSRQASVRQRAGDRYMFGSHTRTRAVLIGIAVLIVGIWLVSGLQGLPFGY